MDEIEPGLGLLPGFDDDVFEFLVQKLFGGLLQVGVDLEEGAWNLLAEKQPSRQFVTVEQLAQVVLFLCSDSAAQLTGAAIPVDGGWTAQ